MKANRRMKKMTQHITPNPPTSIIDINTLLSQASNVLTVPDLKDLLRQVGGKLSGNKGHLIHRLGEMLMREEHVDVLQMQPNDVADAKQRVSDAYNNSESYSNLTIKELKEMLRQHGAKVSGSKKELMDRLEGIDATEETKPQNDSDEPDDNPQHNISVNREWRVLEPSVTLFNSINTTNTSDDEEVEMPFLSGLLFVNKPSGMSTLPTRQQLMQSTREGDTAIPTISCLSDSVKEWLLNHPDGRQRLKRAQEDEERWWKFTLQSPSNAKQSKEWKKKKRHYEKQQSKMATFEPRPVHRLDIDTSGIVCIALTPYALRAAGMLFERKSVNSFEENEDSKVGNEFEGIKKQYVALVECSLGCDVSGVVSHGIGKVWVDDHHEWACDINGDESIAFRRPGDESSSGILQLVDGSVREAVTSYQTVNWIGSSNGEFTRVELTPHTGRGHQLRLHMASLGHPIVGDNMHGIMQPKPSSRMNGGELCLHASKLSLDGWCLNSDSSVGAFQRCRIAVDCKPPF
jgi:23S rRNA-/tRNA-specific pseudouridylate synthase